MLELKMRKTRIYDTVVVIVCVCECAAKVVGGGVGAGPEQPIGTIGTA